MARTPRAAFLASPLAEGAREIDVQTGWRHYYLDAHAIGPSDFVVSLSFEYERFDGYHLASNDPAFGRGWDDWSEAKEMARREANDRWLLGQLGPPGSKGRATLYEFAWGTVWSSFDPKGGSSSIGVRFKP